MGIEARGFAMLSRSYSHPVALLSCLLDMIVCLSEVPDWLFLLCSLLQYTTVYYDCQ